MMNLIFTRVCCNSQESIHISLRILLVKRIVSGIDKSDDFMCVPDTNYCLIGITEIPRELRRSKRARKHFSRNSEYKSTDTGIIWRSTEGEPSLRNWKCPTGQLVKRINILKRSPRLGCIGNIVPNELRSFQFYKETV